jgi:hypothetical protein
VNVLLEPKHIPNWAAPRQNAVLTLVVEVIARMSAKLPPVLAALDPGYAIAIVQIPCLQKFK